MAIYCFRRSFRVVFAIRNIGIEKNQGDVRKVNSIYFLLLLFVGIGVALIGLSIVGGLYFSHVQLGKYDWADSSLMYGLFAISILNIAFSISTSVFSLFVNYKKKFIFGKLLIIFTTALNFAGHFLLRFFRKVSYFCRRGPS